MPISIHLAAMLSLAISVNYFLSGKKQISDSFKANNIDESHKQTLRSLFLCQIGFFVTSCLCLFACAFGVVSSMYSYGLLLFIGLNYGIFAIWHCYIAILSPPNNKLRLYLLGMIFLLISLCSLLGAFI
ncbi:hypothetical protein [Shewanella decolorationis]|uniref:hypothetical protein n=1 Tax=Shewanella decolorationis TaxID=256839 RepID=UPI00105741E6|nr:hypothetical protein [Shewanella decolorationis]